MNRLWAQSSCRLFGKVSLSFFSSGLNFDSLALVVTQQWTLDFADLKEPTLLKQFVLSGAKIGQLASVFFHLLVQRSSSPKNYWTKLWFQLRHRIGNRGRETTMSSFLRGKRWLGLLEREVWKLYAHQTPARPSVENWHIWGGEKQFVGRSWAVFGQTIYHDVEVKMQRKWARSMQVDDGRLPKFREAACDELAVATNVCVAEAGWKDNRQPDQGPDSFTFIRKSKGEDLRKLVGFLYS